MLLRYPLDGKTARVKEHIPRSDGEIMEVVILAGGEGTRLWPLTEAIPKPLVPIKGIPIVQILVDFFKANDCKKFVFCIGYKGDSIRQYFNRVNKDLDIIYVDSGENADILERLLDCRRYVSDRFIACYGDAVADVNLRKLLDFHESRRALVTLTTFRMRSPFGVILSEASGIVTEFKEKPLLPYQMNIGFMVFEKKALDLATHETWLEFLNELIAMEKLYSFNHTGLHYTFNTEIERQEVERKFDEFYQIMVRGVFHEG